MSSNLQPVVSLLTRVDMTTGCTPIVLAIRNNHPEVVRDLLTAGAIVPPPGLTSDPLLLSILYPQPMYGMPPYMGQMGNGYPDFYPQPFYPQPQNGLFMPFQRKESPPGLIQPGQQGANLPPAEVAKTIPCRYYPNCKYGGSCVFYHPPQGPFYGQPMSNGFMNRYEYGQFQPNTHGPGGPFYPQSQQNFQTFQTPSENNFQNVDSAASNRFASHLQNQNQNQPNIASNHLVSDMSNQHSINIQHDQTQLSGLSSASSVFVPSFQPGQPGPLGSAPLSPSPQSQFGMSPLSPSSMMSASLPSLPPPDQFFATSPPNMAYGQSHLRRQSFNQPGFVPPKTFGHGKKLSFYGGPRPWGAVRPTNGNMGTWKEGSPPCAFFSQGKCRNGEFCKFPHLDAEGNDCKWEPSRPGWVHTDMFRSSPRYRSRDNSSSPVFVPTVPRDENGHATQLWSL